MQQSHKAHRKCTFKHKGFTCVISLRTTLQLQRASRSYAKSGFFLVEKRYVFHYFWSPKASKLDLNFELSWRSSWEASWSDVGPMLGGFWESSWSQVGPKTVQDGAKTGQVGPKMAQDGAKTAQDGAKMAQDDANTGQVSAKTR